MTSSPTAAIEASVAALREAWINAAGMLPVDDAQTAVDAMSDAGLLAVNQELAALRRQVDGLHVRVAAGIAHRSRAELGKEGLARKTGHRSPGKLIAAATGGHAGDAARLIQVGEATQERTQFSGERTPARHPAVADAIRSGAISIAAAAAITAMLERIVLRVGQAAVAEAETTLVAQAPLLSLDELAAVLRRAEAHLDPDGLEPVIEQLHGQRSLRITQDAAGMTVLNARLDPETAAPIKAAIEAIVTHQLRTSRGANHPSDTDSVAGEPIGGEAESDSAGDRRASGAAAGAERSDVGPIVEETRSIPQMQADALAALCRHAVGCDQSVVPASSTSVVVRMPLAALLEGSGVAEIDGLDQPIDAATARRMAAAADVIPCVLGGDGEILDWGRAKRFFTLAQRLALAERDGGCAFCHLPPSMTEAHHIRWWERDAGPTNLDNGVLLCTACHHRIHTDGWEIRIEPPPSGAATGGSVYFIPPPHIDPARTPRVGGRRRFDPGGWWLAA